jgi:hypothetical protein
MSTTSRPLACHDVELSLGVLVLGAIDPAERPAVEEHLASCPRCTAILAELAPLPGLMHRLDPTQAASPPRVPAPRPELRERLIEAAQAAQEQTRQARRRRLVVATAAAAVLGALLAVGVPRMLDRPSGSAVVASATDPTTDVRAQLSLVAEDTGSQLSLRLTGVAPGERCRLVAVDAQGRHDVAATWVATYDGRASVTGHSGFRPDRIRRLDVVTLSGRMLVQVAVPPRA